MEICTRSYWMLCLILLTALCKSSEARVADDHNLVRRDADSSYTDEPALGDEALNGEDFLNDGDDDDEDEDEDNETGPVEVLSSPQNFDVSAGSTVVLPCQTSNPDGVVFIWQHKDQLLTQGNTKTDRFMDNMELLPNNDLRIHDIRPEEQGVYTCKIMSMQPTEVRHTVSVNVALLSKSEEFEVDENATLELPCRVSHPAVRVTWQHGNHILKANEDNYELLENKDLRIRNIRGDQEGVYICRVVSTQSLEAKHTVHVRRSPKILDLRPVDGARQLAEGQPLHLVCNATGYPLPNIDWNFSPDGSKTQHLTQEQGDKGQDSLYIKSAARAHTGTYYCLADNKINPPAVHSVSIVVLGKPRVHVHRAKVNGDVGEAAVLTCQAHEQPQSIIKWLKNGREVQKSQHVDIKAEGQTSRLHIKRLSATDFGLYTCLAENSYGNHSRDVMLVRAPVSELLEVEGPKLRWLVHSHAPLELVRVEYRRIDANSDWVHVTPDIPEQSEHRYEMTHVLQGLEPGRYEGRIRAKNTHGWDTLELQEFIADEPAKIISAGVGPSARESTSSSSINNGLCTIPYIALMHLLIRFM